MELVEGSLLAHAGSRVVFMERGAGNCIGGIELDMIAASTHSCPAVANTHAAPSHARNSQSHPPYQGLYD